MFVNLEPPAGHSEYRRTSRNSANPLAALTFAGLAESVRNSNWLALGRCGRPHAFAEGLADGSPSAGGLTAFAGPQRRTKGPGRTSPCPAGSPALSLYRDLHGFYAAKDKLFPERTSGLIFFENMMGIFFSGRDLTKKCWRETEPEIRIVVAEQQYDARPGTPQVQIPAFAVVLRLRHPEQFDEVVEEAWQKAVGLINFTRGQKAVPGLIIDRPTYKDIKYTVAYFAPPDAKDKTSSTRGSTSGRRWPCPATTWSSVRPTAWPGT